MLRIRISSFGLWSGSTIEGLNDISNVEVLRRMGKEK